MKIRDGSLEVTREITQNYIIVIIKGYVYLETGLKVRKVLNINQSTNSEAEQLDLNSYKFMKEGKVVHTTLYGFSKQHQTLYIFR